MWLLGILWSAILSAPPEGAFPAYLEGKEGFLYSVQIDHNSEWLEGEDGQLYCKNPVLAYDGSPLYVGRKTAAGPEVRVSLLQLRRDSLLASMPQPQLEFRSERRPSAFEVRIEPGMLVGLLNYLSKHPESFRRSLEKIAPSKTALIENLLFEDKFTLTAADLKGLQRSDLRTDPPPVEFEISINSALDLKQLLESQVGFTKDTWVSELLGKLNDPASKALDAVWAMKIVIQVDKLEFNIREKRIFFDPTNQRIRLDIVADRASVSGPLHEIGEMKRFINWRGYDEHYRLENGEIGALVLSLAMEFRRESEELWALYADPTLFTLNFLDEQPKVQLHVTGTSSKGVPRDEEVELNIASEQQVEVLNTLSATMTEALTSRFFSDSVALSVTKREWRPGAESAHFRNWVDQIRFRKEGIDISFDSQFELERVDTCVADLAKSFERIWEEVPPRQDSPGNQWGFVWFAENREWLLVRETGEPPFEVLDGRARIELSHSLSFVQWLFHSAWLTGEFCVDTSLWWPRPAHIPRMEARLTSPPIIERDEAGDFRLQLEGEIKTFDREAYDNRDGFTRLDLLKKFRGTAIVSSVEPGLGWSDISLSISNLNDEENQFVRDLVTKVLEKIEFFKRFESTETGPKRFSLRQIAEELGNGGLSVQDFSWNSERWITKVQVDDFSQVFAMANGNDKEPTEQRDIELQTRFTERPDYWVRDAIVRFKWREVNSSEAVFYSWRLQKLDEETPASWSQFSSDTELMLVLEEEGLYEFEVRSMDRNYKIEAPSNEIIRFYYLGRPEQDEIDLPPPDISGPTKSEPEDKTSPDPESRSSSEASSEKTPGKMKAKGAFGCSASTNPVGVDLIWLVLALSLISLRRHLTSKIHPRNEA